MKEKLSKTLLAILFLFLMPNLSMGKGLEGVWKLVVKESTFQNVKSRYKVFDDKGNYYNVDAYLSNAKDDIDKSAKDGVFCPCEITRSGSYRILAKGLYCEMFKYYKGEPIGLEQIPISYRIKGKKMTLLFQLGSSVYCEVYQKVSSVGE